MRYEHGIRVLMSVPQRGVDPGVDAEVAGYTTTLTDSGFAVARLQRPVYNPALPEDRRRENAVTSEDHEADFLDEMYRTRGRTLGQLAVLVVWRSPQNIAQMAGEAGALPEVVAKDLRLAARTVTTAARDGMDRSRMFMSRPLSEAEEADYYLNLEAPITGLDAHALKGVTPLRGDVGLIQGLMYDFT